MSLKDLYKNDKNCVQCVGKSQTFGIDEDDSIYFEPIAHDNNFDESFCNTASNLQPTLQSNEYNAYLQPVSRELQVSTYLQPFSCDATGRHNGDEYLLPVDEIYMNTVSPPNLKTEASIEQITSTFYAQVSYFAVKM